MSDNVVLNPGTLGDTIAADDVGGAKYQRIKLSLGADGTVGDAPVGGGVESGVLRVTLASDSTGVLSVDDNGGTLSVDDGAGSLTVDNAGTFAVQATLAAETTKVIGTVNIAAAQTVATVTTVSAVTAITNALPAGTNAIGKLAANSGVDIGDVDVTTVGTITPGTAATSLGKAEDAAHTSGDVGVLALGVRRDADTTPVSADGDYHAPIFDANGYLKVNIKAGAGSGGTALADAATFTRGTTSETPVAGVVETSAPTLTNGQAGALSLTTGGAVRVAVASGGIAGIAEDSAAAGGEDGVMMLAVRRDSASSGVSADGDFAALSVTSDGSLRVSGSSGTTQYTEDGASAGGEALCLAGSVRRDTAASSAGTDGDYATLNTDANGRLHVIAAIAATQTLATVTTVSTVTNVATIGTSVTPGTAAANLGKAEDAAHSSGDVGVMSLSVRQDTAAALAGTDADYQPLITDASGRLHVNVGNTVTVGSHAVTNAGTFATQATVAAAATNIAKAEDVASADADVGVPAMAVRKATPANTSGTDGDYEMLQMSAGRLWVDGSGVTLTVASHAVTNAGTFATQESGTQVQADDAAFTPATSKVCMAGFTADETATDSVDEGDGGAARMTLDRKQIMTPYAHAAAGGATPYQNLDCDESEDDIKTAPGKLFWVHAINLTASKRYLKFYNATAANTTVGTTTPVLTFPLPTMGDTNGAGFTINFGDAGVQFDTAICVAATTGFAVADTGAPGTNDVILNAGYL